MWQRRAPSGTGHLEDLPGKPSCLAWVLLSSGWRGHVWLDGRSRPLSAPHLSPWEVSVSRSSPFLCACIVLSSHDCLFFLGQARQRWWIPSLGADRVLSLLQSLFLSLDEPLHWLNFIKAECGSIPLRPNLGSLAIWPEPAVYKLCALEWGD